MIEFPRRNIKITFKVLPHDLVPLWKRAMHLLLKRFLPAILAMLTTATALSSPVTANALPLTETLAFDTPKLQATSTTPVEDNRIAALWISNSLSASTDEKLEPPPARRTCTASYLGDSFWLTAHHCVAGHPQALGYLEQFDGEIAGIANVYTMSDTDDVALIKTEEGIDADKFEISTKPLSVGETATLIGYGATNSFASEATTQISKHLNSLDFGQAIYTDLFEGTSTSASRSCSGDSGGPIFKGNVIYAVHTGGGYNPNCAQGQDRLMWHTNISSRVSWIRETVFANLAFTDSERDRAHRGRELHPTAPMPLHPRSSSWGSSF
ncbi:S1 family peptidase [Corynebacterium callunae]|nr:S1 family peptidase [Corynebacterium callunae]